MGAENYETSKQIYSRIVCNILVLFNPTNYLGKTST